MKHNWLKSCDLLYIPMSLSYKNEYFYTTTIGAILTIICFIIILCISIYEFKSLSKKSSFSIIRDQYTYLSEKINFAKRPLLFQLIDNALLFQLIDNAGNIMELNNK